MERQLVVFELSNEYYGVDITAVDSIIEMQTITTVPRAPEFVRGVTNLRGVVLPVINLCERLGLPVSDQTAKTRIIVVEVESVTVGPVGMIVDAVTEVLRVSEEMIEPLSSIATTANSAFIMGIANLENRLIILLDLDRILTPAEKADVQAMQLTPEKETVNEAK